MSLITCPGCHRSFKVDLSVLGTEIDCPKCSTNFMAHPQRNPRRGGGGGRGASSKSNSGPIILAVVGVLGFIALIAFTTTKSDEAPMSANKEVVRETGAAEYERASLSDLDPRPGSSFEKGSLRARIDEYLTALMFEDVAELRKMMNFVAFRNRLAQEDGGGDWSSLMGLDKELARKEIIDRVLRTEDDRIFLKRSDLDPDDFTVVREEALKAEVFLIHTGPGEEALRQERKLEFTRSGSTWMISWDSSTEVFDPADMVEGEMVVGAAPPSDGTARTRRSRALGTVERVEHLADTPPDQRIHLDTLATKLTDLSLTREMSKAKRELIAVGKPAIPSLLNVFVGRDSLQNVDDAMICNQANQALERITHESFDFAPSTNAGSAAGAESIEDNRDALRSWFGWWARNKDTWTGPPETNWEEDDG